MKKFCLIVYLIAFSVPLFAIDYFPGNYQEALKKGQSENKNIFMYFTAKWCGPCRYMDDFVFVDQGISEQAKNYIAMKIDIDTQAGRKLYLTFKVRGVPVFFIISPNEQILKQKVGGMNTNLLSQFLRGPSMRPSDVLATVESKKSVAIDTGEINAANLKVAELLPSSGAKIEEQAKADNVEKNTSEGSAPARWSTIERFFMASSMNKWKPGLKVGYNMSTLQNTAFQGSAILGYYAGFFLDLTSQKGNFIFQPGIQFNSRGGSLAGTTTRLNYLELPLTTSYKIAKGFILGHQDLRIHGAPYLALNINERKDTLDPLTHSIKGTDYGIKTGFSFALGNLEPFFGCDFGLSNISVNPSNHIANRSFYMSIGLIVGK